MSDEGMRPSSSPSWSTTIAVQPMKQYMTPIEASRGSGRRLVSHLQRTISNTQHRSRASRASDSGPSQVPVERSRGGTSSPRFRSATASRKEIFREAEAPGLSHQPQRLVRPGGYRRASASPDPAATKAKAMVKREP